MINPEMDDAILHYCEAFSGHKDTLLDDLYRETYLKTLSPGMISGPFQGKLLTLLVRMSRAKVAVETGTFTGYASICIARGLQEGGVLYTYEINRELTVFHEKYFPASGVEDRIKCIYSDANEELKKFNQQIDFAFIDAGKKDYDTQYEAILSKMVSGGVIVADNVLWKGKVLDTHPDKITRNLMAFNEKISNDARVDNVILPIRDGLNCIVVR